ncbi:MAG: hypothetical protein ACFFDW_11230 [Candidatus Thorarchaeota archaeon]
MKTKRILLIFALLGVLIISYNIREINAKKENTHLNLSIDDSYVYPSVIITKPNNNQYYTVSSVEIVWTRLCDGYDFYSLIKIDEGDWINKGWEYSHTFTELANGTHQVTVQLVVNEDSNAYDFVNFTIAAPETKNTSQSFLSLIIIPITFYGVHTFTKRSNKLKS